MKIDQAGLSAGIPGSARDDGLSSGALVTLTSLAHSVSHRWRLLWIGLHGVVDTTSRQTLQQAGPSSYSFSPTPGSIGSWRIELVTDEGTPAEDRQVRIFAVKSAPDAIRIPAANEVADPEASLVNNTAAYVARSEFNAGDDISGSPQEDATFVSHWRPIADLIHAYNTGGGGGGGALPGLCSELTLNTGNNNDQVSSPDLLSTTTLLLAGASGAVVTGLEDLTARDSYNYGDCYALRLLNITANAQTLKHESGLSAVRSRLHNFTGADISLAAGTSRVAVYRVPNQGDLDTARWYIF